MQSHTKGGEKEMLSHTMTIAGLKRSLPAAERNITHLREASLSLSVK